MCRPPLRALLVAVVGLVVATFVATAAHSALPSGRCWPPPVDGVVTDPFRPPACPWCAGNRGLEYRTAVPAVVRSATPGVVSFAGSVAGVRHVVVRLPNGWRLTYGRLALVTVAAGRAVTTGTPLGAAAGELYFGLRIGDDYHDPAPHLGELVGVRRLIPADGRQPRPAPPARLRCADLGPFGSGGGPSIPGASEAGGR